MNRRVAAAVLIAWVAGVGSAGCHGGEPSGPAERPVVITSAPPEGPVRVVTLGFAGDVHFQLNLAALLDHPRGALGPIARTLRAPDVTMVNLESAITSGGIRDPKELEVPSDRYWFRTTPDALGLLARAGVDVVTMANNHGADYGPSGLADTLRAVRHSPIPVVGIGRDRTAAFAPYRLSVEGTDLAFIAADASPREGSSPVWAAGANTAGIAAARGLRTARLLAAVQAIGRDEVVVVYLHWGVPGRACPSGAQRQLARDLAAAGADVVVGSHAHVPQGAGWLGDTYVAYGLGNFLWYHNHHPDTGVLRLRLENGAVVSDGWVPAEIQLYGRTLPLQGAERSAAVARWRHLRACAGLAARPASAAPPERSGPRPGSPAGDLPAFRASVRRIGPSLRARMSSTHAPGCPTPWADLRHLRLSYVGFDGAGHPGELVVASRYARDVVAVFARLYAARWPIRQLRLASDYGGDDDRSMAADNSSGYNCRRIAGTDRWSDHARGAAVDLNPVENPYVVNGSVRPTNGRRFAELDRTAGSSVPPGTLREGDVVVRAFAKIGWEWGGTWRGSPDFQHFAPR